MIKKVSIILITFVLSACSSMGGIKEPPKCVGCERTPINIGNSV